MEEEEDFRSENGEEKPFIGMSKVAPAGELRGGSSEHKGLSLPLRRLRRVIMTIGKLLKAVAADPLRKSRHSLKVFLNPIQVGFIINLFRGE